MRLADDPAYSDEINTALRELYEDAFRKSRRQASKIDKILNELDAVERGDIAPF